MPSVTRCRLEYLTPKGNWVLLAEHDLLHPDRYAVRLTAAGKVGRAVEVGGRKRVWSTDVPADPSILVATTDGAVPYRLPRPGDCAFCFKTHAPPHDGGCLI